jgi:Fe-S cluster assembly protein SufD
MATVTPIRTAVETALANRFSDVSTGLPGAKAQREAAILAFKESGLPHRRIEAWHYSDLRSHWRDLAPIASQPDEAAIKRARALMVGQPLVDGIRLVLVDGHFVDSLSDLKAMPGGLSVTGLASALRTGDKRTAKLGKPVEITDDAAVWLNTAYLTDGLIIEIDANARIDDPIQIVEVVTAGNAVATHTRILVLAGANSEATIAHTGVATAFAHQLNSMSEFALGQGADIVHGRIDTLPDMVTVLSTLAAALGEETRFSTFNAQAGSGFVRHQPFIRYGGENAVAKVHGVNLLKGEQHADLTLTVDHAVPHGTSRELIRSVIDGSATGVFQGKIKVAAIAQKTDGQMASNALLLSDNATMNNKPELEIFADDVVCAHGATCGALNDDQLFYLMARGLPRAEAEALLIEAFVNEAIEEFGNEALAPVLTGVVQDWLAARR